MSGSGLRSCAERNALVEKHLPLVRHVVARMPAPNHEVLDREDLLAAGALGLIRAAELYDESRGTAFSTLAYRTISSAVLDELRRLDPMSRGHRARMRAYRRANDQLREILGRSPSIEEVADHLEITAQRLEEDLRTARSARTVRLDHDVVIQPSLEPSDPAPGPDQSAAEHEELERYQDAVRRLSEREQRVLSLYLQDGLFLKEIGDLLGITESRVSQILSQATRRLEKLLETGDLER